MRRSKTAAAASSRKAGKALAITSPPRRRLHARQRVGDVARMSQSARAELWLATTGARLTSTVCSAAASETWETSTITPRALRRRTIASPRGQAAVAWRVARGVAPLVVPAWVSVTSRTPSASSRSRAPGTDSGRPFSRLNSTATSPLRGCRLEARRQPRRRAIRRRRGGARRAGRRTIRCSRRAWRQPCLRRRAAAAPRGRRQARRPAARAAAAGRRAGRGRPPRGRRRPRAGASGRRYARRRATARAQ